MRKYIFLLSAIAVACVCFSQALQRIPGHSKIIYFGDSQTSFGYSSGINSVQFQNNGYISWVNAMAPGVYMPRGGMQGVPGETTNAMLSRLNGILGLDAKVLVVVAGTNDPLYGMTPANTETNLRKIYNAGIAAGMKVIAVTIMPRFAPNAYSATNEANRKVINNWIKSQTDVVVVDVEDDLNDPIYFADGLHNSPLGAYVVGSKIAAEINKQVAACAPGSATEAQLSVSNTANPYMAGTTGKKDNALGTVASNWLLGGKFAGGANVSGSKEADGWGRERQIINISGTYTSTKNANGSLSTPKAMFINNALSPISMVTGDVVQGFAEIEITSPMVGVSHLNLTIQGYTADFSNSLAQASSMWPTSSKPNYMPPGRYVLRTPPITVGSGTVGQLATQIIIEFVPTTTVDPVSANIKITSAGIMKQPLTAGPSAAVTTSGGPVVCPGTPVVLNAAAGAGSSYQWQLNGNDIKDSISSTLYAKDPGSYTVTISSPGCKVLSDAVALVAGTNCPGTGIQTGPVSPTFCTGRSVKIPFSTTGLFDAGNIFVAQLSDAQGSFANPVIIGTSPVGGLVNALIPPNLAPGSAYRVRVVSSSPAVNGSDNGQNINLAIPPKAVIAPAGKAHTYPNLPTTLTAAPQGGYAYQWVQNGAVVAQNGTTPNFTATVAGQYRVAVTAPDGCSDSSAVVDVDMVPCSVIGINVSGADTTQFLFTANGGVPPFQYALDGGSFQTNAVFTGFRSSRSYTVTVKDSVNCTATLVFTTKAAQTISFGSLGNKLTTDPAFPLGATASSGLPVSYRVVSGPASVSANMVTLTGSGGEVVIEASQSGGPGYYPAPVLTQSFVVVAPSSSKANQTISFGALNDKTFGDLPFALNATASSGLPVSYRVVSGPVSLSGNTVTFTGSGAVVIEASQIGNNNYNPALPVTRSFTINKATQSISFSAPADKVYGDTPFVLSAMASSGLAVAFEVTSGPATVSGNTATISGAGTIVITASQQGNGNYNPAPPVSRSILVAKASQTLSFAPLLNKQFGDAPFNLQATVSSGLPVSYRLVSGPATLTGDLLTLTGIGDVSLEASQPGDGNFFAASPVVQTFNVSREVQTINFGSLTNRSFGEAPFTLSATATSGLPVSFAVIAGPATITGNTVATTGVGAVTIEASQAGTGNIGPAMPVQQSFTVLPAAQTISFAALANKIYGDGPFALNASSTSGLPVFFRVVSGPASILGNVVSLASVGTVVIEASQGGNGNYSAATPVQRSFTVVSASSSSKQNQTISFASLPYQTYSSPPFSLTATASSGLPVSYRVVSGPISLSGNVMSFTGTGSATVEATQFGDSKYNAAPPVQRSFTVGKAGQTISFPQLSGKSYGDAPFALNASATSGLPVSYRVVSGPAAISGTTVTILAVGNVTIEASQPGNANYNAANVVQRSFAVAKGSQSITFPAISNRSTIDGPFALSATSSANLPVSYRILSGPANVTGNVLSVTGAGNITVEASQAGDANVNSAAPVSRTFTVFASPTAGSKLSQVITFDPPGNRTYGDAPFTPAATASSGLEITYEITAGPAIITAGGQVALTGAGTVTIEASQPGDGNYNAAAPVSQSFTINKAPQAIRFGTLPGKTFGDPSFALSATASSGLPVFFRIVSGPATVTGNVVSLAGSGWVSVEASQTGSENYFSASPVLQSFFVAASTSSKQSQTISFGTLAYKTYTRAPFELNAAASSGLPVSFRVVSGPVTISGTTVTITGVGTATIEASQPGNAGYFAASPVQRSFTIGKGSQTIIFPQPANKTYGDPPFALSATASSGLTVGYRVVSGPATVSGNQVTLTGAGSVNIEASQAGDANFSAAFPLSRTITVTAPSVKRVNEKNAKPGNASAVKGAGWLKVYPNPASAKVTVEVVAAKGGNAVAAIYNTEGKLVKTAGGFRFEKSGKMMLELSVIDLAPGAYVLRVITAEKTVSQLFQVMR